MTPNSVATRFTSASIAVRVASRHIEALSRQFYLPPDVKDQESIKPPGTDLEIWTWQDTPRTKYVAVVFQGKSSKPLWYLAFRTEQDRDKRIEETIAIRKKTLQDKLDERTRRKEEVPEVAVGDIFSSSWGYDQTNVDFYQVVGLKGPKMVLVREIGGKIVQRDRDGMSETVVADPNKFVGPPMLKKLSGGAKKTLRFRVNSYSSAYWWDGRPQHQTGPYGGH